MSVDRKPEIGPSKEYLATEQNFFDQSPFDSAVSETISEFGELLDKINPEGNHVERLRDCLTAISQNFFNQEKRSLDKGSYIGRLFEDLDYNPRNPEIHLSIFRQGQYTNGIQKGLNSIDLSRPVWLSLVEKLSDAPDWYQYVEEYVGKNKPFGKNGKRRAVEWTQETRIPLKSSWM